MDPGSEALRYRKHLHQIETMSAYVDDIFITARTKQAMTDAFNKVKMESIKYGLEIGENKILYMKCTRTT
jgi:hypothetical protein